MKVSVITVNRNNAGGLKKTIESVILQTFTNYELIIIDGASTDGSIKIIEEYSGHIKYWVSESDRGTYHAMNKGIKVATGEFCYFLNSGDFLSGKNVFEEIFKDNTSADIISGNVRKLRTNNKFRSVHSPELVSLHKLCIHSLPHQATLIRRALFKEIGYYTEEYRIASDWEFFLKALILHEKTYHHLELDFSYFKLGGISSRQESVPLARKESYDVLRKLFPREADDLMEFRNFHNSNLGRVIRLLQQKEKLYRIVDNLCGLMISGKKAIRGK